MSVAEGDAPFVVSRPPADPGGGEAPFVVQRKVFRLVWNDGPYAGLVVRARSLPLGVYLDLAPRVDALTRIRPQDLTVEQIPEVLEPFRIVGDLLVSWNLTEDTDGVLTPVPATYEGLISQDPEFITEVMRAWMRAAGEVAAPLAPTSEPGPSPEDLAELEASLGMSAAVGPPPPSGGPG